MTYQLVEDEIIPKKTDSLPSQILRGTARTATRVGEQIAGLPGDIFSLINEYIAKPGFEAVTGQKGSPYEQTYLGKILPTTEQHRKATKSTFGEYTEPQNKYEKFVDEIVQDATSLAVPGFKEAKLGKTAFSSLAKSTGANLLGDLAKDLTGDEKKGAFTKLGSLLMFSLFDKPRAAKAVGELYKPLADKVTTLKPVNATGAEANLLNLKSKLSKGTIAPSEKFVIDEVDAILSKINNGKITPEEAWSVKRSLNEKLSKALFEIPKKSDQARAKKLAQSVLGEMDDLLKETAKQDPKFYKELKSVDKAFGTIAKSNIISNFLENNMQYTPVNHYLIELFKGSLGSAAGTGALPYQLGKIIYRISNSPVLAKHYSNVLSSAAIEDSIVMNRELKKLDEKLSNEKEKDRFQLID